MLYPAKTDRGWGYINRAGEMIIEPEYEVARPFREGFAVVKSKSGYAHINLHGEFISDKRFVDVNAFFGGMAQVKFTDGGRTVRTYIDSEGGILAPIEGLTKCHAFSEGMAGVCINERWGFINTAGEIVIEPAFEGVNWFVRERALIVKDNKFGVINHKADVVVEPRYAYAEAFTPEGLAAVAEGVDYSPSFTVLTGGIWGFIDVEGDLVIEMQFKSAEPFSEGMAAVSPKGVDCLGFINTKGDLAIEPVYQNCYHFKNGLAAAKKNDKWGYITPDGSVKIDFQFEDAEDFSEGIALVDFRNYIDLNGNYVWRQCREEEASGVEGLRENESLSPDEALLLWADEQEMGLDEFIAFIKKTAIDMGMLGEDEEWFDEMTESELIEWLLDTNILG